jgi:hypothetical protein
MKNLIEYNSFLFESKSINDSRSFEDKVKFLRGVSDNNKKIAIDLQKEYSRANKGVITELNLHPDLIKKIKEKKYPDGFSMGIDKNGFFVHTHRARSKSHKTPSGITAKEMKFIDSTG